MSHEMQTFDATVLEIQQVNEAGTAYLLALKVPEDFYNQARPGMFCAFEPKDKTHTQRRPFSIARVGEISRPPRINSEGWMAEFIIQNVGSNSEYFTGLQKGNKVNITYPRGREVTIKEKAKRYILVGGGAGIAPIVFLESKLKKSKKEIVILEGAKTLHHIISKSYFVKEQKANYKCIVEERDDNEPVGVVTDLLSEELKELNKDTEVITCGPLPMMKAVAGICAKENIPCQILLESVFACNQGACLGCAVFMLDLSVKHICKDGPAFYTDELDWTKLLQPELEQRTCITSCDMSVTLKGEGVGKAKKLKLSSPIISASGTQSAYSLASGYVDITKVGAILTKGITLKPKRGNEGLRVCETPAGMLNAIGLENMGIDQFLKEELKILLKLKKPIIVNINGGTVSEFVQLAEKLEEEKIVALEINISCPNVKQGGMAFGVDPFMASQVVEVVRKASSKFLIVKLTPNVTDITEIGKAVVEAGADAISAINTVSGMAIDIQTRRPKLGNITGGLSGPAIKPIGVKAVHSLAQANLGVPIIGLGGITNHEDALEYIIAGAGAVQIGTAGFTDEKVFTKTMDGIKEYMLRYGFTNVNELSKALIL